MGEPPKAMMRRLRVTATLTDPGDRIVRRLPGAATSRRRARPGAHGIEPAVNVGQAVGRGELDPAGELDGDEGGDVGDAVIRSGDELAVGQALVQYFEEVADARLAPPRQRRDLLVADGAGQRATPHPLGAVAEGFGD